MRKRTVSAAACLGATLLLLMLADGARAGVLVESWEGSANGWVTSSENASYSITGTDSSNGVTNGSTSLAVTGSAGPSYGQMLDSPFSMSNTTTLQTAANISVDVLAGSSFGYQQWTCVINNPETGYASLDGFSFSQSPVLGTESTLTWTIPAAVHNALVASPNASQIIFQVGGGGGGTMYLDNLQVPAQVPEPATIGVLVLSGVFGFLRRGQRAAA
jgi:hypothetical protein